MQNLEIRTQSHIRIHQMIRGFGPFHRLFARPVQRAGQGAFGGRHQDRGMGKTRHMPHVVNVGMALDHQCDICFRQTQ